MTSVFHHDLRMNIRRKIGRKILRLILRPFSAILSLYYLQEELRYERIPLS